MKTCNSINNRDVIHDIRHPPQKDGFDRNATLCWNRVTKHQATTTMKFHRSTPRRTAVISRYCSLRHLIHFLSSIGEVTVLKPVRTCQPESLAPAFQSLWLISHLVCKIACWIYSSEVRPLNPTRRSAIILSLPHQTQFTGREGSQQQCGNRKCSPGNQLEGKSHASPTWPASLSRPDH